MTHNIDGAKLTPKVINELIELQTKGSALIYREQIENIIDFLLECHILDDSHPAMILANYYLTSLYLAELKERNAQISKLKMQMSRFNDDF